MLEDSIALDEGFSKVCYEEVLHLAVRVRIVRQGDGGTGKFLEEFF